MPTGFLKDTSYDSNTFVSYRAELTFVLLNMDGEERAKRLAITQICYEDKLVALAWYQEIVRHLNGQDAIIAAGKIYTGMIGGKYPEDIPHG